MENGLTFTRATGTAATATTLAPGIDWNLESIRVHLSAAGGAGNLTATVDSGAGAAYDVVLLTQDMTSVSDLVWIPDAPIKMQEDDELDVAWANANGRTYGLEIVWKAN